ncbi:helix-turn-helix domain-containing protein [Halomonas sp. EGI 63088]|uniref:Helix-turn-helix domain-containing protein n=1 Tax=Halomonas flagellata TaxID=2920385 RepID=A0ABS9RWY5_9GAMM|nr:helix-turn-helix domain-containing protein [Halomonas flagellata]MCH4564339.1 helix-turn-helix domain-containing protein [Halomonas flagellata]
MQNPEDVAAMLRLKACGWGDRRIADELDVSKNTVKRYLRQGGWAPYASPQRTKSLDGLEDWLQARFLQHAGNAAVVLQDLQLEHGLTVSLAIPARYFPKQVAPLR